MLTQEEMWIGFTPTSGPLKDLFERALHLDGANALGAPPFDKTDIAAVPRGKREVTGDLDLGLTGLQEVDLSVAGRTALLEGRIDDAIRILEQTVDAMPDDFQAFNWLGIAYGRRGDYQKAIQALLEAVHLAPANERYWYNLGTAYQACGLPQHAARHYQVALRLAPDYDRAAQALTTLQVMNPDLQFNWEPEPFSARTPSHLLQLLDAELVSLQELPGQAFYTTVSEVAQPAVPGGFAQDPVLSIDLAIPDQPAYKFPGIPTRITAAMIDLVVIQVLWIIVVIVVNLVQQNIDSLPNLSNGVPLLLGALVGLSYLAIMTSREGQTIGKQLMRVQVVDRQGRTPSLRRSFVRSGAILLDLVTAGIGYAWLAVDRRRQSFHDKLCATYVIGRRMEASSAVLWIAGLSLINVLLYRFLWVQLFG